MPRHIQLLTLTLAALALMALAVSCSSSSSPRGSSTEDVFTKISYDQAKQQAQDGGKLFIVDATATWCGPCQRMEKTTWVDPKVKDWFKAHAVAVQVDVDVQKPLADELKIEMMPTIIAFKDGKEVDRVVGLQSSDELITWLDKVNKGK